MNWTALPDEAAYTSCRLHQHRVPAASWRADLSVIEDYRPQWIEKELENKAVYDLEDWSAVDAGECPLIVHTLTLDQMMTTNIDVNALKY